MKQQPSIRVMVGKSECVLSGRQLAQPTIENLVTETCPNVCRSLIGTVEAHSTVPIRIPARNSLTYRRLRRRQENKRRGRDSNPRSSFPDTAFPVLHNRPLCHLSSSRITICRDCGTRPLLRRNQPSNRTVDSRVTRQAPTLRIYAQRLRRCWLRSQQLRPSVDEWR